MKIGKYNLLPLLLVMVSSSFSQAEASENDSATEKLIDQVTTPDMMKTPIKTVGSSDNTTKEKSLNPSSLNTESHFLPFWGDAARIRGYELPEPFGINANYMNIRQNISVDSINFSGLSMGFIPINPNMFKIQVGKTREKSKTETARFDAWILPFMNIYGLVGHTKGTSLSKINVAVLNTSPSSLQGLDFKLDFKGTTYGAGTTLVGGYHDWFALMDLNYTRTNFNILDGSISAYTFSPRIGYRFTIPEIDVLHMAPSKLNVWVGSMYQDIQQEFKGKLSDLNMPSQLQGMLNLVNKKDEGRFRVKQRLQSPWNVLVGAQYEITRNFNVATEVGFAERNSVLVSGEVRF